MNLKELHTKWEEGNMTVDYCLWAVFLLLGFRAMIVGEKEGEGFINIADSEILFLLFFGMLAAILAHGFLLMAALNGTKWKGNHITNIRIVGCGSIIGFIVTILLGIFL